MQLINGAVWVVVENNDMLLYGADGRELPCQENLIATADVADGVCTATVSFVCNIAGSKEEMLAKIEEAKHKEFGRYQEYPYEQKMLEGIRAKLRKVGQPTSNKLGFGYYLLYCSIGGLIGSLIVKLLAP